MSRLHTSFILGYHGCEESFGRKAINGKEKFKPSSRDYDWLGDGIYFWESDPRRAKEWALEKKKRGGIKKPYVVGAIIDLGNCLDLTLRENAELVRYAHSDLMAAQEKAGLPMPANKPAPGVAGDNDLVLRYLDCAVMKRLHSIIEQDKTLGLPKYDSVRALFGEGKYLYEGSGFREKTHIQIAVRNPACIKGVFLPMG